MPTDNINTVSKGCGVFFEVQVACKERECKFFVSDISVSFISLPTIRPLQVVT